MGAARIMYGRREGAFLTAVLCTVPGKEGFSGVVPSVSIRRSDTAVLQHSKNSTVGTYQYLPEKAHYLRYLSYLSRNVCCTTTNRHRHMTCYLPTPRALALAPRNQKHTLHPRTRSTHGERTHATGVSLSSNPPMYPNQGSMKLGCLRPDLDRLTSTSVEPPDPNSVIE